MRYMLLVHGDEKTLAKRPESEMQKAIQAFGKYTEDIQKAGKLLAFARLQPTMTATCVRNRDGKQTVMDGPFAETKEQLGGYYLVEAKDLNEALAWAKKLPAHNGTIEVRPVWEM